MLAGFDITLRQLQILQSVVVAGSLTKASQLLGVSQPSISQQLLKLEDRVGARLVKRTRSSVELTPAGEFWCRAANELLERLDAISREHQSSFMLDRASLRMIGPPTFRGRFATAVSQMVLERDDFVKIGLTYGFSTPDIIERVQTHKVNCAILEESGLADEIGLYRTAFLFDEFVTLATPARYSIDDLKDTIEGTRIEPGLLRHIEPTPQLPVDTMVAKWYRYNMPASVPVFSAPTFSIAISVVAAGHGTTLCPSSLIPNLSEKTLRQIRLYRIPRSDRRMVLAMPRHLMTLRPYAEIFGEISAYVSGEYRNEILNADVEDFPAVGAGSFSMWGAQAEAA